MHLHYVVGVAPVGLSLPTAVAVVQQSIVLAGENRYRTRGLSLRHLDLIPAGTALVDLGLRVVELAQSVGREEGCRRPEIVVDATALGLEWEKLLPRQRPVLVRVGGSGEPHAAEGGISAVSRVRLVTPLARALQEREIKVGHIAHVERFLAAMQGFNLRAASGTDDSLEAARATTDDAFVTAASLSVWRASNRVPGPWDGQVQRTAISPDSYLD